MVVFSDLRAAYDGELDRQLISGIGTTEHLGIRAVASINTVTYTASTPTGGGLLPKVYDAIPSRSGRTDTDANIAFAPETSGMDGKELSSTVPLFQQGNLLQAVVSRIRVTYRRSRDCRQ